MSKYIPLRRKNGQFAGNFSLPARTPQLPPPKPSVASPRLPEHLPTSEGLNELTRSYKPTQQEVINVLNLAKKQLVNIFFTSPTTASFAELDAAQIQWKKQSEVADYHGDDGASDAFLQLTDVAETLATYLDVGNQYSCRHYDEEDYCESCYTPDVESLTEEIIEDYLSDGYNTRVPNTQP